MFKKFEKLKFLSSKIGSGATPTGGQASYKNEGISLIRSQNVLDMTFTRDGLAFIDDKQAQKLDGVEVKEDDILLNITGDSIARVCKVPKEVLPARVNQHVSIIRSNGKISPSYLLYYLIYRKNYLLTISRVGGTRNALTKEAIENIEIRLDDNNKDIASVLTALDDKIELNNRINTELEQMAKTLYDYWFVQFDFPNEEGKSYKASGGKMEYSEVLKREIPKGWSVTVFNDWIEKTKTGDWGKEEIEGNYTERVYCVRGADINGLNGKGEVKAPERFILKNNLAKKLEPNDFIIEISGGSPTQSTARIALITKESFDRFDADIVCSNFCKAVTLKDKSFAFNFQKEWQRLYDAGVFFGFEGKTSGIKNFLFESFMDSYDIVKPPKNLVSKYYEFCENIEKKRQLNLRQNQELSSLRDWLLPMLMNGQVTVQKTYSGTETELPKSEVAVEPVAEYGNIANLSIPEKSKGFAKQVLGGKIVSLFKDDPHFTHIKFQKLQYLAEHIAEADLDLNYYFQAAGPHDGRFMHTIADKLKNSKWFEERNYRFHPLEKQDQIDGYYQGYFAPVQDRLDKLFRLLANATESDAEIFATLYAVWNNLIILKEPISDTNIIEDFYKWSDRKLQYSKDQLLKSLEVLRNNQMAPTGFGKEIKTAKNKSK